MCNLIRQRLCHCRFCTQCDSTSSAMLLASDISSQRHCRLSPKFARDKPWTQDFGTVTPWTSESFGWFATRCQINSLFYFIFIAFLLCESENVPTTSIFNVIYQETSTNLHNFFFGKLLVCLISLREIAFRSAESCNDGFRNLLVGGSRIIWVFQLNA